MQKLPIGIQSFEKIRTGDYLYIDKTKQIYDLVNSAGYFFLSRPRRFGKSLLISTLKELFLGNKELFKGLFIEDKIEWKKYSVVHLDFAKSNYKKLGLELAIKERLQHQASLYEIELIKETISSQLEELIRKLKGKYNQQVVLLIDEYDKPIIDFLGEETIHIAEENRDIMKDFYSPIKSLDDELEFFFLTGVSRFSKVSIFSDLNHLNDISIDDNFSTLVGYTQKELELHFEEYINKLSKKYKLEKEETLSNLKSWYNGYSWTGEERLYNPFSVMSALQKSNFDNYWFTTGTPTFLVKLMREERYYDMDNTIMDLQTLSSFDITNMQPVTVLFQTGYLTLIEEKRMNVYKLGYPNREVKNSMLNMLLNSYTHNKEGFAIPLAIQIEEAFVAQDFEALFVYFDSLFAKIPYQIFEQYKESYYHSVIFLTLELLGFYIDSEVSTSRGRIDAVVKTEDAIFILEFKVNGTAEDAIKQIKEKGYADKYKSEQKKKNQKGKQIYLIGVAFKDKSIDKYLIEELE
ncbi:MAG: AAA family ATPase [Flexibacter sp. CG_4_10_14_3_um_filter_32_15]|nr:MAG: AAA family ATPase [Flexibacter sp. CG_4_10_14_3_um_filter_32_15]